MLRTIYLHRDIFFVNSVTYTLYHAHTVYMVGNCRW